MTVLPAFPQFVPLQLQHRALVLQYTASFPLYADFTFASLYSWNIKGLVAVSDLYGNLVVQFSDDTTNEVFLSFLGTHELEKTIDALLRYSGEHLRGRSLCLVPEVVIRALPRTLRTKYHIEEDRNNHEYILSVRNICKFTGANFRQRRTNYKKFAQKYAERISYGLVDLSSPDMTKEVKGLLTSWRRARGKSKDVTRNEFTAIFRCLTRSQKLNIRACGTYLDGKLVALNLFEVIGDTAVGHFIKADTHYRGVSEHLVRMFARYLRSKKVTSLNIQQDAGIQGLRDYKLSYNPVGFMKKYTVSKRQK